MTLLASSYILTLKAALATSANIATMIEQVMTMTVSRVRCLRNMEASLEVVVDCMPAA